MRRLRLKNVSVAYPGTLGGPVPDPPPGYAYLTDDDGKVLKDDNGTPLVVPVTNA